MLYLVVGDAESELKNAIINNQELNQLKNQQQIELYKRRLEAEKHQNEIAMLQVQMKDNELEIRNRQQQQRLKEQQIEVLEQERRLKNAELQKSEAQKIILILSIVISGSILLFVVVGYINSRKLNEKIAAKNMQIEENNIKLKELNEKRNFILTRGGKNADLELIKKNINLVEFGQQRAQRRKKQTYQNCCPRSEKPVNQCLDHGRNN